MFGTSLLKEYRRARDVLGFDRDRPLGLAAAGIQASYAPARFKSRLMQDNRRS